MESKTYKMTSSNSITLKVCSNTVMGTQESEKVTQAVRKLKKTITEKQPQF